MRVGEDVELDLLIELLEFSGIPVIVIRFWDDRLEIGGVIIGLSFSGCLRIVSYRGCHSYGGMGGLCRGFCVY
jgi:hypothetical protein